ncbi:unnamed protein product [Clonostachys rosea]|uniref:Protein kinase domain-containing protein n=1 Tax=Bionectria ochroleuca TaxID=29856 RepID=A0ABY6UZ14_BIOOC|nr:unnamed protein product [Clonostachys rosea]
MEVERDTSDIGPIPFMGYLSDASAKNKTLQSLISSVTDQNVVLDKQDLAIVDLIDIINDLNVTGPYHTIFPPELISSGAQFTVEKAEINSSLYPKELFSAAVKTPKFMLDPQKRLDLSEDAVRQQVCDLIVEIVVLHHPHLRRHKNIVNMFGWGYRSTWQRTPLLALELADNNLGSLMSQMGASMSFSHRHRIIRDIACGLTAVHEIEITHGDLKPENILVFRDGEEWAAKLTDFGGGAVFPGRTLRGRGTVGWRAPELRRHHDHDEPLDLKQLSKIDIYSFGLVCWHVVCQMGRTTRGNEGDKVLDTALADLAKQRDIPSTLLNAYQDLIRACLSEDPRDRPVKILNLLPDHTTQEEKVTENRYIGPPKYSWEIVKVEGPLADDLLSRYHTNEESVAPDLVFGLFLNLQFIMPLSIFSDTQVGIRARLLRTAAMGGIRQARALIPRYYEYFDLPNEDIEAQSEKWLYRSISTGDLAFSDRTRMVNPRLFDDALDEFQAYGGYNSHYQDIEDEQYWLEGFSDLDLEAIQTKVPLDKPLNESGDCLIHLAASFHQSTTLKVLKTIASPANVNMLNMDGESPLFKACLCGVLDTVLYLLEIGADPTLRMGQRGKGPSCLHYLFAFHPDDMEQVAAKLIEKGASVSAMSVSIDKMLHYPYRCPPGSPLHWAVEFSCSKAIEVLLSHGADPWLPNGRPQFLLPWNGQQSEALSHDELDRRPLLSLSAGPSAVDLAIQQWNHSNLCLLLDNTSPGIHDRDRDGIRKFHNLLLGNTRWIATGQAESFLMRGGPSTRREQLRKTIQTLLRHGFPIDALEPAWYYLEWEDPPTSTSLMIAVSEANLEVAEALLEAGADVNVAGDHGQTAIMDFGPHDLRSSTQEYEVHKEIQRRMMRMLLAHGARIDARSHTGMSRILEMAKDGMVGAIEVLLEHGAMINDRHPNSTPGEGQFPVVQNLVWRASDSDIAALLRKYLIPWLAQAPAETSSDPAEMSLLYNLTSEAYIESVGVLLDAGFNVNPVYNKVIKGKVFRFTPLDKLLHTWNGEFGKQDRLKMSKSGE